MLLFIMLTLKLHLSLFEYCACLLDVVFVGADDFIGHSHNKTTVRVVLVLNLNRYSLLAGLDVGVYFYKRVHLHTEGALSLWVVALDCFMTCLVLFGQTHTAPLTDQFHVFTAVELVCA